jgi:NDP-4-keto-2,6-dideoxyhexose 3-C-methyltransferase
MNKQFTHSVVSNEKLIPIFSLGELYVSDFIPVDENPKCPPCELTLGFDPVSKVAQLMAQPPAEAMFTNFYWYLSSTNPSMAAALKDVAQKTVNCIPAIENSVYLDVGSNDNTLLSNISSYFIRIGIDPSKYDLMEGAADLSIRDYFSADAFNRYSKVFTDRIKGYNKARYISCCACLYNFPDPVQGIKDMYEILEDDGVCVIQLSYTPLMLIQCEVGNLTFEHLTYFNLTSLKYITDLAGFVIKDVELNNVNGGSLRVYLQKESARNFKTPADNDIAQIRIKSLLEWEENNGYNSVDVYEKFYQKIQSLKRKTLDFIVNEKSKGKTVFGYGASTKFSTLSQVFQLNVDLVSAISEKQDRKVGLKMTGSNLKIISDSDMRLKNPDYLLIGPWFFLENFKQREKEYLDKGGSFILTSPEFSVYRNESI